MATLERAAGARRRPRRAAFAACRRQLDDYWQTFDPLFDWTPAEKIVRSAAFLRREVVPRREAVLAIAQEIEELNNANVAAQRAEVARRHAAVPRRPASAAVAQPAARPRRRARRRRSACGCSSGDPRSSARRRRSAERQMRELSQQLVATQEEERKNLSRELHDHVGAGADGAAHGAGSHRAHARVRRCARRCRPSPSAGGSSTACSARCATWRSGCGRACSTTSASSRRSSGTSATSPAATAWTSSSTIDGNLDALPDRHRTCVYRAVQEALTNCVRHAMRAPITITVTGRARLARSVA